MVQGPGARTSRTVRHAALVVGLALVPLSPVTAAATPPGENGILVFTSERDGDAEIFRMEADGSNQLALTDNVFSDRDPSPSPDGRYIAFESNRDGNFEIFLMDLEGNGVTQLTQTQPGISNLQPTWSPNARRIAFSSNRDGNYDIYTMNTSGLDVTRLTSHAGQDTGPAYSVRGNLIGFTSNRTGNFDVFTVEPAKNQVRQVTFSGATDFGPEFSPDGLSIAFASNRTGDFEVFSNTLAGNRADADANAANLSNRVGVNDSEIAFAPDGTAMFWEGNAGSSFQIFTRSTTGASDPTQLTDTPARNGDPRMAPELTECADNEDNDDDGWTDHPEDPGCASSADLTESPNPQCSDGTDNDGDGAIDYPLDRSCNSYRGSEGKVRTIKTSIAQFRHDGPFRGRVVAELTRCRKRPVHLLARMNSGNVRGITNAPSNERGRFALPHDESLHARASQFRAEVLAKSFFTPDETLIVCTAAKSAWITPGAP